MTHASLDIIRHEHRAISAMLRSILLLLGEHRSRGTFPDFSALRAMLFYVDEFPEKLHHPKESRLLFPKLRGRSAGTDAVLDRLERYHEHGEHAIRELEHALLGFEMMVETDQHDARRDTFERSMTRYVDFYLEHMHVEETDVLPMAEAVLGTDDWAVLDVAFLANCDPFAGHLPSLAYAPLFAKILRALAPSSGIGSALEALSGKSPPKFA